MMKKLMLSVSVATALALTGCGGGSDSPASSNTNTGTGGNNSAGSNINAKFYAYEFDSGLQGRAVVKSTITVESGLLYQKDEYPVKTANFQPYPEGMNVFLTQENLYEQDRTATPLGMRFAFVEQLDDKGAVYAPYSLSKNRSLKFTTVRQKVDLSGTKLSDILFLNQLDDLIKPIQQGSAVFPQGSVCWRELSQKSNKDVLSFDLNDPAPDRYKTLDDFAAEVEENEVLTRGSWLSVPWITSTYQLNGKPFSYSAVQYKTKIYNTDTYIANQDDHYSRQSQIAQYEAMLLESPNSDWVKNQLNALKNSCDDFNQVAADTIDVALASIIAR